MSSNDKKRPRAGACAVPASLVLDLNDDYVSHAVECLLLGRCARIVAALVGGLVEASFARGSALRVSGVWAFWSAKHDHDVG
jgi:hypothetical protein